ncbi:MAG: hypothetical protein WC959_08565 [Kiritimatiellales bacterium]
MLFKKNIKKVLAERGFTHSGNDATLSIHGEYARHIQYVFSKEHFGNAGRVMDLVFLTADFRNERIVIGFFRENVSVEHGVLMNTAASIPLLKFSIETLEKELDRIIPSDDPANQGNLEGI